MLLLRLDSLEFWIEPRGAGTEAEPAQVYRTFPSTVGAKLAAQLACQRATRASCWEPCSDAPVVGNPAVMIMLPARGARRLRSQRATLAREGGTRRDLSAAVGRPSMTRKTSAPIRLSDFSDFRDWIARANSANIWQIYFCKGLHARSAGRCAADYGFALRCASSPAQFYLPPDID